VLHRESFIDCPILDALEDGGGDRTQPE